MAGRRGGVGRLGRSGTSGSGSGAKHARAGCAGGRCRWGATREGPPTTLACTSGNAAHGELVRKISKLIVVPAFARLSSISFT